MSTSGSTSSDLAKGKKFLKKLLYVQHVDKEKETASEISDRYLEEFLLLADRTDFRDSNFTEYLGKSPKANLSILKSSMRVTINQVTVYSNPLPIPLQLKDVTIHAFVVFDTENYSNGISKTWWSLEKNGKHIVLQQSTNEDDVIKKIYDTEKKTSVERLGPIKKQKSARNWRSDGVRDLMRIIVDTNKLNERYHLLFSNCQNFASFVFEKLSHRREKWSTMTSAIVDGIGLKNKKIEPENKVDAFKYKSIVNDDKFDCYWAMMEGRRKDFEKLTNHLTIESLNRVDSQGYTLIEWATVFSSSHWPIDEQLKKKGAKIPSDEGSFRRNVFFIALQYLPPAHQKLLSFDGIDISGVNGTGDTSLHLSLYGDKREIAETILNQFEDYDVNSTNSLGDTPLLLAARLGPWDFDLFNVFKRIVERTNQENINKADRNGWTALHYAIDQESETQVEELLKRDDVDVNIQNNEDNRTALHLASNWPNIPMDLFQIILQKTDNINAQDVNGNTALHFAIGKQCDNKVKELLKHENHVNVNVKNNTNDTPLHLASKWTNISADLFKIILEKSTDINAQDDEDGRTALHNAILCECDIATKALLAHNDVDFNVKNNTNETPLHLASKREEISSDLFKLILEKSRDINAQDNQGNTALHYAILGESEIATEELLKHSDVNVNIKNYYDNITALHFACCWKDIPVDLFNLILENSTDINTPDEDGRSALYWAIFRESEMATKELLAHNDVNVNFKNRNSGTALYSACLYWKDIPVDLFKIILEKTADVNAQCDDGRTALHWAIICKSDIATKELLAHKNVNVNVKDNKNKTALSYVSMWKAIPSDLFKLISERSTNEVKKISKMDRLSK